MKTTGILGVTLLLVTVMTVFMSMTPTSALVANIAPHWDFPTDELQAGNKPLQIDLNFAFFDPDGDTLTYYADSSEGIKTVLDDNTLDITAERSGAVIIMASDGRRNISHILRVKRE